MVTQNDKCIRKLLTEVRSGDRAGAEHLAVIIRKKIYPFVLRNLTDPDVAEDIMQDTLLSVLLNLKRLRDDEKFWSWVYRISRCKIQDYVRRRRLHLAGNVTLAMDRSGNSESNHGSILDAKIHEEKLRQVAEEIDQLSYEHRDIIRLRYYEQLSYEQIASRTQLSPKIARARTFRAKKRLKACLV